MLDDAGLHYVKILVSNELDEYIIAEIIAEEGKVDVWGVGTNTWSRPAAWAAVPWAASTSWSSTTDSPK